AQNHDGSFGWFAQGAADPYMTAYVLRGLNIAHAAGISVPVSMYQRAYAATVNFLTPRSPTALGPVEAAWVLSAVTSLPVPPDELPELKQLQTTFANLYAQRDQLTPA